MNKIEKLIPELRFPEFIDEGNWEIKKLGEAADFINGRAYKQDELLSKGKYRVLRVGNFFTNNEWYYSDLELDDDKYCDKGDLLYAWSASFGSRLWSEEKVIYHYHIWKVKNKDGIDRQFFFHLLDYETLRIKSQSLNGFALMHITKGTIENWESILPKSEIEQKKIASCLSSLDELIQAHSQKLDTLKDHKKGLMQNLFPQEGEKVPKYRFSGFENDGEWKKTSLSNHIDLISGFAFKSEFFSENGMKLVTPKNFTKVGRASFNKGNTKYTTEEYDTKYLCNPNDLLVLLTDLTPSCELLGKPILLTQDDKEALLNQRIVKVKIKSELDQKFLLQYFLTETFHRRIISTASGSTVRHSSNKIILETGLLIPNNPKEQQKISTCLFALDDLITAQSNKIEQLKEHKKGLMQRLFPNNI
ncbi:restriction endonuclease subunit S [Sunxiuqinia indica]|uniref:restriction endonuclease subunit S n=1 Tax=Sunxiuqinia indica TaxID=2692584 RepID=UPI00135BC241|nr:restriction endonuclease subunit S [Sunxiuqinia indica]